ncbi:MAG: peptidoglycan DD-metalloendopeptidase family protein [Acidobacteria bacterium]|nr:peptidoglycan DD-metalloendopeptidase family protein [Acidobacteriota bacterium]
MIAAFAAMLCLATPAVVPVEGRVVDWFRPPGCAWCSGNRGLEIATTPGGAVVAPVTGTVEFAGPVGGVDYLVISAAEQPLLNVVIGGIEGGNVVAGEVVTAGQPIARARTWLYVGFRVGPRRDGRYLDPAGFFGLVRKPARLVAPDPPPVSLTWRSSLRVRPQTTHQRHCSVLPPVVASAREPGP